MKKQVTSVAIALVALCGWLPANALEADQVKGEIVDVMPDQNRLTLRVEDSGDQRPERAGAVETYELEDSTDIRRGAALSGLGVGAGVARGDLTMADLEAGDEVILNFEEIAGRRMARNVAVADREEAAAARRNEQRATDDEADLAQFEATEDRTDRAGARDRLPATASFLPLLALGGLGFGGAALLLRIRRR